MQRVQSKLASMLDRLEVEIQSVEKRIGDKLHILDRDKVCRCLCNYLLAQKTCLFNHGMLPLACL